MAPMREDDVPQRRFGIDGLGHRNNSMPSDLNSLSEVTRSLRTRPSRSNFHTATMSNARRFASFMSDLVPTGPLNFEWGTSTDFDLDILPYIGGVRLCRRSLHDDFWVPTLVVEEWLFLIVRRSASRQRAEEKDREVTFRLCWDQAEQSLSS
jgi:hypothetical protein